MKLGHRPNPCCKVTRSPIVYENTLAAAWDRKREPKDGGQWGGGPTTQDRKLPLYNEGFFVSSGSVFLELARAVKEKLKRWLSWEER